MGLNPSNKAEADTVFSGFPKLGVPLGTCYFGVLGSILAPFLMETTISTC